jgi:hypothetical protein
MPKITRRINAERAGKIPPRVQVRLDRWRAQHRGREPHHQRSRDIPAEIHEMAEVVATDYGKLPEACSRPDAAAVQTVRRRMREARL